MRETDTILWSSISLTSLRASSTGWTFDLKARPKMPSKTASIFCSIVRRTLTASGFPPASLDGGNRLAAAVSQNRLDRERGAARPDGEYDRQRGGVRKGDERRGEEGGAGAGDRPQPSSARKRQQRGDRDQRKSFEGERAIGGKGAPEHVSDRERMARPGQPQAAGVGQGCGGAGGEDRRCRHRAALEQPAQRPEGEGREAEQPRRREQRADGEGETASRRSPIEDEPGQRRRAVE